MSSVYNQPLLIIDQSEKCEHFSMWKENKKTVLHNYLHCERAKTFFLQIVEESQ